MARQFRSRIRKNSWEAYDGWMELLNTALNLFVRVLTAVSVLTFTPMQSLGWVRLIVGHVVVVLACCIEEEKPGKNV